MNDPPSVACEALVLFRGSSLFSVGNLSHVFSITYEYQQQQRGGSGGNRRRGETLEGTAFIAISTASTAAGEPLRALGLRCSGRPSAEGERLTT